jgi:hypothetical protein
MNIDTNALPLLILPVSVNERYPANTTERLQFITQAATAEFSTQVEDFEQKLKNTKKYKKYAWIIVVGGVILGTVFGGAFYITGIVYQINLLKVLGAIGLFPCAGVTAGPDIPRYKKEIQDIEAQLYHLKNVHHDMEEIR